MKHNIIYIDDELENLRSFKSVFRRVYNIFTTDSPSEGIDYLRKNKVDLIITDQRMPEMTGTEFLKKVYEFMPGNPPCRMIYSGYCETQAIELAKKKEWISTFISKPCDPKLLKKTIDKAISNCKN
jgi:response regulator RpfG family c-di-GMP phosphodiesterase